MEDGLGAKIEGLEREMAEMRLEMRELRATMGQMLVLLSQFTTASVASSALVASASVIPGMWENKATTHGSDPTDAEDAAYVRDEQDRGEIKPMMEDMNCGASAPYEDHENEEVDERASGTYDLPVELWMHILGFVARQQRNPEGQVCIFASLSSVLLASRFWRKVQGSSSPQPAFSSSPHELMRCAYPMRVLSVVGAGVGGRLYSAAYEAEEADPAMPSFHLRQLPQPQGALPS